MKSWLLALCLFFLGFQTLKAQEILNVFLVPHSHDDVGWLMTIDEYYEQQVRNIYNTVVEELDKRADRKFIIVEILFFTMWWAEATQAQKDLVFKYVANGQVEFVLGGWSMGDDADPTYSASINQLSEGHRFTYDTFGVLPKYGWHIDPFGLSSYLPTLFSKMGFNGHVINRIHYTLKDSWKTSQHLEFVWRGSKSLGSETEMLTHVLDSHYSFPSGFDFEGGSVPITDANIASRAQTLVNELIRRSAWYRTNNLLIPGGDDFRWQNAAVQYENWDKLIDYINARSSTYGVTIRYSTLGEYFDALHATNTEWPIYENDFFPYADGSDAYWTGFFTSHSELKGYIRSRAALLRATELYGLSTFLTPTPSGRTGDAFGVQPLRWATAEAQHHDAITGTSKMKVIDMYFEHLVDGSEIAEELLLESMGYLVEGSNGIPSLSDLPTVIENMAVGSYAPIIVGNTLGWNVHTVHEFVCTRANVAIWDQNGQRVRSQVIPYPFSDDGIQRYQIFFEVDLPAAGFRTYYASISNDVKVSQFEKAIEVTLENEIYRINITNDYGSLFYEFYNKRDFQYLTADQQLMEYTSYTGSGQKSGAYIFRPTGSAAELRSANTLIEKIDGDLVQYVYHEVDATHRQAIRLYKLPGQPIEEVLEVQFSIGVLNLDREAIVRFSTSLTNTTLYSDSNGIEMRKRPAASGSIQQNYYPMVAQSFLTNSNLQFGALSERTVGVASLATGQLEMMLHRRCSQDDGRGMGEALNDDTIVTPSFRYTFGAHTVLEESRPHKSVTFQHRPRNFYGPSVNSIATWANNYRTSLSIIASSLPNNVHLLAFKVVVNSDWEKATIRLMHIYEKDNHPVLSQPASVVLETLFNATYYVSQELELSGLTPMAKMEKLRWNSERFSPAADQYWAQVAMEANMPTKVVNLNPMQIKTYELTFI